MEFKLEGEEYIELQALLKVSGLADTGGAAKMAISAGEVTVDGVLTTDQFDELPINWQSDQYVEGEADPKGHGHIKSCVRLW